MSLENQQRPVAEKSPLSYADLHAESGTSCSEVRVNPTWQDVKGLKGDLKGKGKDKGGKARAASCYFVLRMQGDSIETLVWQVGKGDGGKAHRLRQVQARNIVGFVVQAKGDKGKCQSQKLAIGQQRCQVYTYSSLANLHTLTGAKAAAKAAGVARLQNLETFESMYIYIYICVI